MKTDAQTRRALAQYADTVRRVCFLHLNQRNDVEDVFQEVFLKHALYESLFESEEHERAWLIRVAINACRDLTRRQLRRRTVPLDAAAGLAIPPEHREVLDAVLSLNPPHYRDVIYLHYFEGYKAVEIAALLRKNENTIYTWLDRARKRLRGLLGGEWNDT